MLATVLVLIIGQWIFRENFVCGFFTTLMLCASLLQFCKIRVSRTQIDYYSSMDGSAKFLLGTMGAFTVLYIIAVVGGVAVGVLDRNMYWKDALDQYVMLSSGYLVLFVVPLFLASLGFKTSEDA